MINPSTLVMINGSIALYSLIIVCLCLSGLLKTNERINFVFYSHATALILSFVFLMVSLSKT